MGNNVVGVSRSDGRRHEDERADVINEVLMRVAYRRAHRAHVEAELRKVEADGQALRDSQPANQPAPSAAVFSQPATIAGASGTPIPIGSQEHKHRRLRRMIEDLEAEHQALRTQSSVHPDRGPADSELRQHMRDLQVYIDNLRSEG